MNNRSRNVLFSAVAIAGFVCAPILALAQEEVVGCEFIRTTGDYEDLEPNFRAAADRAEFTVLAPMRAVADGMRGR